MDDVTQQQIGVFEEISPMMLFPGTQGRFSLYLKQQGEYVLYAKEGEQLTFKHRKTLRENGVNEVYIKSSQKGRYFEYLEKHLGTLLQDEQVSRHERAAVLYSASVGIIKNTFEECLPPALQEEQFNRVLSLVRDSVKFLSLDNALKTMAAFISHDYMTYSHCVQVMVYTTAVLASYGMEGEPLVQSGLGAILHDLGKTRVPKRILNKPSRLNADEREVINTHPLQGVSLCTHLPLTGDAMNCILFHHERLDGKGYPGGLKGDALPLNVRAVAIADVYDAMTSDRPYAKGMKPYEALCRIRDELGRGLDMDVFKRFISILSGAEII